MKSQIKLQQNIKSFIRSNLEGGYVAECLEISVVTQGDTLDEVVENLIEAVGLHLEDENPEDFGLVANPSIFVTSSCAAFPRSARRQELVYLFLTFTNKLQPVEIGLSRSAKETCKCPDPRLFLGKQRQLANLQKKSGILTVPF